MDRTEDDVEYARENQDDLENKNKGAWNYTDVNRICNNLKYAAEYMYDQGFLPEPYPLQIKLDWTEADTMTIEQLNTMIVNNMNNLKSYSRIDLPWNNIALIANMDFNTANQLEQNIHNLATQEPLPPDAHTLEVEFGYGSGVYYANDVVTISSYGQEYEAVFDHWSGDHLENIENATSPITTYTMPHEDIKLTANYHGIVPHKLTIITESGTEEVNMLMGIDKQLIGDPAPFGKVFHHWKVDPEKYEENLYEPAATTTFTMPNENVTIEAVYVDIGKKQLVVINGEGSGEYEYMQKVVVKPTMPEGATFSGWSGDVQYLKDGESVRI